MKTPKLKLLAAIGFVILTVSVSFAHDTWLFPSRFAVAPNESVKLDLTSGMEFPALESGPKRERVQAAKVRLSGRTFDITDIAPGEKSLVFATALPDAGVATIWVQLPARSLELTPEEVQHYLDEIDAPQSLRAQWEKMTPKRWRESYQKHQKTFVRVGDAKDDRSWSETVGSALEIVPERDPTSVREGEEFAVRVLKNGAPHRDFALNALAANEKKGETRRTDDKGRVSFRLNKAGAWLLRGTDLRKSDKPDTDWESDFATLTLEVKPK